MPFRIQQSGRTVESFPAGFSPDEVCRAALAYRADGEVVVQCLVGESWMQWAVLCQWVGRAGDPA